MISNKYQLIGAVPAAATPVLGPSFPRRSRDHGRSSREADQDQNRRGEAIGQRKNDV